MRFLVETTSGFLPVIVVADNLAHALEVIGKPNFLIDNNLHEDVAFEIFLVHEYTGQRFRG